ncbi:hypothetical protein CP533_2628 [Ophiocordyceps camponoti-saundersi (nom. inval.)]|nr:hypothetical protein CP533_2628 [Ophiocordyceps camponoti-saundersi (nom. inval.)]
MDASHPATANRDASPKATGSAEAGGTLSALDRLKLAFAKSGPDITRPKPDPTHFCLLSVDGKFLPYHHITIRQLGAGGAAGIFSDVSFTQREFSVPSVHIRIRARNHNLEQTLFTIILPIAQVSPPASVDVIDTSDTQLVTDIFTMEAANIGNMRHSPYHARSKHISTEDDISTSIAKFTPSIIRIQANIPFGDVVGDASDGGFSDIRYPNPDLLLLADSVRKLLLQLKSGTLTFVCYIADLEQKTRLAQWQPLAQIDASRSPFSVYLQHVRNGSNDLALPNINLPSLPVSFRTPAASNVFLSLEHRNVALIAGAAEEKAYQDSLARTAQSIAFAARLFPDPTSRWTPDPDNDVSLFGTQADNSHQAYFLVVDPQKSANLLPEVNEKATIYLTGVTIVNRHAPVGVPGPREAQRAARTFDGRRLPLPAGLHSNHVLFRIKTPKCTNWPPNFHTPPAIVKAPAMPYVTSVADFVTRTAWPIQATICWKPRATTAQAECAAINLLNQPSRFEGIQSWWKFSAAWRHYSGPMRNLLEAFPVLRQEWLEGKFRPDAARALERLQRTRAGIAFIAGCPGSGKSTIGMHITRSAVSAPVKSGWIEDAKSDFRTTAERMAEPKPFSTNPDVLARSMGAPAHRGNEDELLHLLDAESRLEQAPYSDPTPAPGAAPGKAEEPVTPRDGRAIWTTPSNQLCDDALERALREIPNKLVLRVFPILTEKANAVRFSTTVPALFDGVAKLDQCDAGFAYHLFRSRSRRYADTCLAAHPHSLSETAKTLVRSDPSFAHILEAATLRDSQPEAFQQRLPTFKAQMLDVMQLIVDQAALIIATPVALAQLASSFKMQADLIIIDDAGRMTEPSALIALAKFPQAAAIFIGDPRQLGPISLLTDVPDHPSVFARQRQTSLLSRAFSSGAIDGILSTNYRCFGDVASWAASYVYYTMHIFHRLDARDRAFRASLSRFAIDKPANKPFLTNSIWLDLKDLSEQKVGTSFVNPGYANIAVAMCLQLLFNHGIPSLEQQDTGKILILCAYAQQRAIYQDLLQRFVPQSVPANVISVRTIDDSQSHQAEFVVIDMVRSDACGFLNNDERLLVATTRARLGTAILMNKDAVPTFGPLFSLLEWHEQQDAVHVYDEKFDFAEQCARCLLFGHSATKCNTQMACVVCGRDHAVFRCPSGPLPALTAPDNVVRDISIPNGQPRQEKRCIPYMQKRAARLRLPTTKTLLAWEREA